MAKRYVTVPVIPAYEVESGVSMLAQQAWIVAIMKASAESARLNKIAAVVTGISVILSGISSVLGAANL